MRNSFHYVVDPGHSWLKVPVAELERLGISDQISSYSYLKNGMSYLEEDRDMQLFLNTRQERNEPVKLIEFNRTRMSPIRNYPAYQSAATETVMIDSKEFDVEAEPEAQA